MIKQVYNLEFPPNVHEIKIGAYLFKRTSDYGEKLKSLHHLIDIAGSEFHIKPNSGGNQITAIAEWKGQESPSNLPWGHSKPTELDDILLLLSLFTTRNVFVGEEGLGVLIADPRIYHYGGILPCSVPYETEHFDRQSYKPIKKEEAEIPEMQSRSKGLETILNKVLVLISTSAWLKKYGDGYFMFLYRLAIQRMSIETNFTICWSIWTHLFSVLNQGKLTEKQIRHASENEKIEFIMKEYFYPALVKNNTEIERLSRCRHRVVHFGVKSIDTTFDEMDLFIRATECLVAKILEIDPSNVFDTMTKLPTFLKIN